MTRPMIRSVLMAGLCTLGATACGSDTDDPTLTAPPLLRPDADPPIARWEVLPQVTDPGITTALDAYIVRVPRGRDNGRLFVYLPSSRVGPWTGERVQNEAARLGYHVIGLSYPNNPGLVSFCPATADPDACYETSRLETLTGEDVSPHVSVTEANSIIHRLTRLLDYLAETHPEGGWTRFLAASGPKWDHIAVGGHSQGAGYAAMLAKLHQLDRAVMLSGVTDAVAGTSAAWVVPGATSAGRLYGLVHQQDNQFKAGVLANWASMEMDGYGAPVVPELSAPPYGGARMFVTNITPANGSFAAPAPHGSTGVDLFTPLLPGGVPVLRQVWQYMLGYCPPPGHWGQETGDLVPCRTDQ